MISKSTVRSSAASFEHDFRLLEAENGEQALALARKYHEHMAIILLDLNMPVKDGYQLMTELKEEGLFQTARNHHNSGRLFGNEVKAFDLGASISS